MTRSIVTARMVQDGVRRLVADLDAVGDARRAGDDCVMVHSSLRSFGHLVGGAQALYQGIRAGLGPVATIVAPCFTPQLCHPSTWRSPDLAAAAASPAVAAAVPTFDEHSTPASRTMGVLPELIRALPHSRRSRHPHVSFVAEGPRADDVVRRHEIAYRLSADSPLGALYDLDAVILMLGTAWEKCTALHLAEYAAPYPGRRVGLWAVPEPGLDGTRWRRVPELLFWEGDFDALGAAYTAAGGPLATVRIGGAACRAVRLRPLIRFAAGWLPGHRDLRRGVAPPGWAEVREHQGSMPAPDLEPAPGAEACADFANTTGARA